MKTDGAQGTDGAVVEDVTPKTEETVPAETGETAAPQPGHWPPLAEEAASEKPAGEETAEATAASGGHGETEATVDPKGDPEVAATIPPHADLPVTAAPVATAEEAASEKPAGELPERVTLLYSGETPTVWCAGKTWQRGKAQTVPRECAERALTHPAFARVEE